MLIDRILRYENLQLDLAMGNASTHLLLHRSSAPRQ